MSHLQDFALRAAVLPARKEFNKQLCPSGEPLRLKQEHRAGYPQQPAQASVVSENVPQSFGEIVASSPESSVQTPVRLRSQVNDTGDRPSPRHECHLLVGQCRWAATAQRSEGSRGARAELPPGCIIWS